MNWLTFSVAAWVLLGLHMGASDAMSIGPIGARPDLLVPLVVFVALHAPQGVARWAALIIGVVLDLVTPVAVERSLSPDTTSLVGPHVLGLLLATQFTLGTRGVVISKNPFTLVVLALLSSLVMHLVVTCLIGVRSLYDDVLLSGGFVHAVLGAAFDSIYTAVVALPMAFLLFGIQPAMGFQQQLSHGRFG